MRRIFANTVQVQHLKDISGTVWTEIPSIIHSELVQTENNSGGLKFWQQELSVTTNYDTLAEISDFANGVFRLKIKPSTGAEFIWGTAENPVESSINTQEGSAIINFARKAELPEF